ncbi:MAG: radical SAM protein [Muribaculum sp.]|nr:radical SAM protein [Muribaculum sp.]
MQVITSLGSIYSYNPYDNSISEGLQNSSVQLQVKFKPITVIKELDKIESYTIGVTERCNLRCTYCCYSGIYPEHRTHSNNSLKIPDIPKIISFIEATVKSDSLRVEFYGGESLLELEWIKTFVDQISNAISEKQIKFELSTNGILLNKSVVDWLVQNKFHLFVSIDGIGKYHDLCRKYVGGHGTFAQVRKNLEYIKNHYPEFWRDKVDLMITISNIRLLPAISREWSESELLSSKMPIRISEVAGIYNSETTEIDFDSEKQKYLKLVKYRIENPDESLIKTFFDIWLAEWTNRPIFELNDSVEYPTCLPNNKKLYIDAKGDIGICERITDTIRIGDIKHGLNFDSINNVVRRTVAFIDKHCSSCPSARICDICPDVLKLPSDIVNTYCHNQRTMHKIKFLCFCELAEADMI